jgi:DNA-binding XRE family transcriptional regulator
MRVSDIGGELHKCALAQTFGSLHAGEVNDQSTLRAIGDNLRAERARRNLTQEQLAYRADMAVTQLARMERGEVDAGVSKFVRVAAALGAPVADLFVGVA